MKPRGAQALNHDTYYSQLPDRIGRTPVIGVGMLGLGISTALFGISTTFPAAVSVKFLSKGLGVLSHHPLNFTY